jgi:hypothetical protein
MHGKSVRLHQDGVASAYLLYRPEVTEELTLVVGWLRSQTSIELEVDEMEALGKALTKAVKKIRKHKKKLAERRVFNSLDEVSAHIHKRKGK